MLTMQATIKDLDVDNEILSVYEDADKIYHTSSITSLKNTIIPMETTAFVLGRSTIGNYSFNNDVDYFISVTSNSPADYFIFAVYMDSPCDRITICFDTNKNIYPSTIYVNNTSYSPDNSIFTIYADTIYDTAYDHPYYYSIRMLKNEVRFTGYPTIISGFFTHPKVVVDANSLISLDITMNDRATLNEPSFGINSATGTLSVKDESKILLKYIEGKFIKRGSPIYLSIYENVLDKTESISKLNISKLTYDDNEHNATFSVNDWLINLQEINIDKLHISSSSMTALQVFNYIKNYATNYTFDIKTSANNILTNTTITYPYLESTNVWSAFYKLCNLCGLYMYMGTNGEVVVDTQLPYEA